MDQEERLEFEVVKMFKGSARDFKGIIMHFPKFILGCSGFGLLLRHAEHEDGYH